MNRYLLLTLTAGLLSPVAAIAEGKIPDYVLRPYDKQSYPSYFKKFRGRMDDVQKYRELAAKKAASNRGCVEVVMAEISRDKSTKDNMKFWVDCTTPAGGYDMKRFNFTEAELNNPNSVAISAGDKALSETQAIKACETLIKRNVNYPSTLKINRLGAGYSKYEQLGNTRAFINFKAKNAFGLELKYRAICTFKPANSNGDIVIKERSN